MINPPDTTEIVLPDEAAASLTPGIEPASVFQEFLVPGLHPNTTRKNLIFIVPIHVETTLT
jgi:hypothetical protein